MRSDRGTPCQAKGGGRPPERFGKTLSGERVRLADYRGRIVIVSFWASWCPACRKELPLLASIQKQATRDKIVVLPVVWAGADPELYTRMSLGEPVLCTTRRAAHSPHNVPVSAMNCEEKLHLILACDVAELRLSQAESVRAVGGTPRLEHQRLRRLVYDARRDRNLAMAALQAHRRTHGC